VWILAIAPLATVVHRLWRVARTTPGPDCRRPTPPGDDEPRGFLGVLLFRWKRLTVPFDIQAGVTIVLLVFVPFPEPDWVRLLVAWLGG
jgi:hypothetical protein